MESQTEKSLANDICCAREQTFREVLNELIELKENQLRDLRALSVALPLEINSNADRAFRYLLLNNF